MTKEQVKTSLSDIDTLYSIVLLDGSVISGAIDGPYLGYESDPRGYTEPYIQVTRIDIGASLGLAIKCSIISAINLL